MKRSLVARIMAIAMVLFAALPASVALAQRNNKELPLREIVETSRQVNKRSKNR